MHLENQNIGDRTLFSLYLMIVFTIQKFVIKASNCLYQCDITLSLFIRMPTFPSYFVSVRRIVDYDRVRMFKMRDLI